MELTVTLAVSVMLLAVGAHCCSPPEGPYVEPTMQEKTHWSDTVVYGKVLAHYPQPDIPGEAYIAKMEVYCTLKGETVPAVVNISDAGYVAGLCHSSDLKIGEEYIVLVDKMDDVDGEAPLNRYRVNDMQIQASEKNMNDVMKACGMAMSYPEGQTESRGMMQCPQPATEDLCIPTNTGPNAEPEGEDTEAEKSPENSSAATTASLLVTCIATLIAAFH